MKPLLQYQTVKNDLFLNLLRGKDKVVKSKANLFDRQ